MPSLSSRLLVAAATIVNALITVAKLVAGAWSGSAAMLSAAVCSAVDTGEALLLLLGVRLSRRPPDAAHPFGFRKLLSHWCSVAGATIFAAGAALAIYGGVARLRSRGEPLGWQVDLYVIAAAAVVEGVCLFVSWRKARRPTEATAAGGSAGGEDRAAYVALIEDGAALVCLTLAALGIALFRLTGSSFYDAAAAISIGCVLGGVAFVLAREARGGTVGAGAREDVVQSIRASAEGTPGLTAINRVLTMQIGPRRILVALDVALEQGLTEPDLGRTLRRLEEKIRRAHPVVRHIYVDIHRAS
jgi:cation diffusion facilitator family transporter